MADWTDAGGGESGYVVANPLKPEVIFAGSYGGLLTRKDFRTGFSRDVSPWPVNPMGESSEDIQHRFQWTFPIVFDPHHPGTMYVGGSELWRSTDEGDSWEMVNKTQKLVLSDPKTMGPSGGPITRDQTGVETYATIFTTFSASRLFTPVGSRVTDGSFFIPGTSGASPATVSGFGVVFTDVDLPDGGKPHKASTLIEYFDRNGKRIFASFVPSSPGDASLSFIGIKFDDARIASIRITTDAVPGKNDNRRHDIVMMDDFIYGEPQLLE
jgi:hypothetical protein